jgi:uncharacterized membrane protein
VLSSGDNTVSKLAKTAILLLVLGLTINITAASPADLDIFPKESSTKINSFTSYEVTVTNTGPVDDVYDLSSSREREMTIAPRQVPEEGTLAPGESETVQVWFNPNLDREEGTYTFTVTASSQATGENYQVEGIVNVIRDHDVTLSMESPGPVCRGDEAVYQVFVSNTGTQEETFRLTADAGSFSAKEVTVDAGDTKQVELRRSSSLAVTDRAFNVKAESTSSYAEDTTSSSFIVNACYESDTSVTPDSQEVAALTGAEFEVTVENEGTRSDSFQLSSNYGEFEDSELTIASGDSKTTTLTYTPQNVEDRSIQVTAEGQSTSSGSADLSVYNGQDVSVSFETTSENVCESTRFEREFVLENTGVASDTYAVSAERGNLSTDSVELAPGETRRVDLELDSGEFQIGEDYTVNVTATAETFSSPSKSSGTSFTVENCYDLDMEVVPHVQSAGENRSVLYEIRLENPGTQKNTYRVSADGPDWISVKPEQVSVAAGEMEKSYIYAGIPYQLVNGTVEITAVAEADMGDMVKEQQTVELHLGEEVKDAIRSDEGGGLAAQISDMLESVREASDLTKLLISVLVGLVISAAILYREW